MLRLKQTTTVKEKKNEKRSSKYGVEGIKEDEKEK